MSDENPDLVRRDRRNKPMAAAPITRLPPNSPEAEQGILGCILLDPQASIGKCVETLKEGSLNFYDLRNQTIYETMVELWDEREPVDLITLCERLKAWQQLEEVGGISYISSLPDAVPSAANIDSYLEIVREKYLIRRMIAVCTETVAKLYDFEGDVEKVLDETERDVLRVNESRVNTQTQPIRQLVRDSISEIEAVISNDRAVTGLSTGFVDLDRITRGLQPGDMIVIAARPSMGKTSLGMNIAEYVAVDLKLPVAVFSLEMTARQLTKRMVCSRGRVSLTNALTGFLSERDFPKLTNAAGKIANAPIYIDDGSGQSILQIRAKARRLWQQYGIKLVVIDYLQLMNALGGKRKFENRQQEVTDISHGVKELAKELNIPVVVLSQLNRDLEREKNRKPRLSDLRESGSIEQDADLVGMLYKPSYDDEDGGPEEEQESVPVNLLLAKHRNGPTALIPLTFMKAYTRFESAAKVSDEDMPSNAQPELGDPMQ